MTSFLDRLLGRSDLAVSPMQPLGIRSAKATMGDGWLTAYQEGGINLSSLGNADPQAKAARLLQAYKVDWFNKAERKISTDFANLAVSVAPEDNAGDNEQTVIEPDLMAPWDALDPVGQFLRLMEKPNENQTGRQLRQKTMIRLDMAGWAFWYTELGTDRLPVENGLYGISPARLWPSYDRTGKLIGYVMDKNRDGGGIPFEVEEIIPFSYASADEGDIYGVGVVEAVWQQVPLTDLMARHTGDVLAMGGRLAGAMWPKNRALDEAEFEDAKRAWRNVASDPNAARRLLIFPEPMEWSGGSVSPTEIGIPELAILNRDDILTAFPISPYQLGVPMPGGLNSAATREEDRRDYWEGTIHPRVELFEETVQTYLMSKYEEVVGYTLDFEIEEPNLDDAGRIIEKVGALDALTSAGFDEKEAVAAVALDHIKFIGKPEPTVPDTTPTTVTTSQNAARGGNTLTTQPVVVAAPKSAKVAQIEEQAQHVLDPAAERAKARMSQFFTDQRHRVEQAWRKTYPPSLKTDRLSAAAHAAQRRAETKRIRIDWATKSDPTWWDGKAEDDLLTDTMRGIYLEVGTGGLQAVSDNLGRVVLKGFTQNVLNDLLSYGGERIKDINARTLEALTIQLAEGTQRGYSINQLIDGVPEEGYGGVLGVTLDNGTPVFDEYRAEMIARTETMLSYNRATVTSYGEFGVRYLQAYDGDGDEMCANRVAANPWTVEDALGQSDHPNGTLVWSPIVDKSIHEEGTMDKMLDMARTMHPTIEVPAPIVNVEPPAITIDTTAFAEAIKALQVALLERPMPKIVRDKNGRIVGLE